MKKFNLDEYLKDPSKKVITNDGREARIICTDAKGDKPIIALVYNNRNAENVCAYNRDGYFYKDSYSCLDLFFAPTKREGWVNIYREEKIDTCGNIIFGTEEEALYFKSNQYYITTVKIEWEE